MQFWVGSTVPRASRLLEKEFNQGVAVFWGWAVFGVFSAGSGSSSVGRVRLHGLLGAGSFHTPAVFDCPVLNWNLQFFYVKKQVTGFSVQLAACRAFSRDLAANSRLNTEKKAQFSTVFRKKKRNFTQESEKYDIKSQFLLDNKCGNMLHYIQVNGRRCNAPRTKIQGSTRLGFFIISEASPQNQEVSHER